MVFARRSERIRARRAFARAAVAQFLRFNRILPRRNPSRRGRDPGGDAARQSLTAPELGGFLTAFVSLAATLIIGVQILSLKELGRFSSLKMLAVAASWGWHEPGANVKYLASAQGLAVAIALVGALLAVFWAARSARTPFPAASTAALKSCGEVYLFIVVAALFVLGAFGVASRAITAMHSRARSSRFAAMVRYRPPMPTRLTWAVPPRSPSRI